MRSRNEKSSTRRYWISRFWRSGWDSNPRAREGKCISSAPRYDRFDTAPRILSPKFLFQLKTGLERTGGENYKKYSIRVPKKLRKNKEKADTNCTHWLRISSQGRYNHFDTAPFVTGCIITGGTGKIKGKFSPGSVLGNAPRGSVGCG